MFSLTAISVHATINMVMVGNDHGCTSIIRSQSDVLMYNHYPGPEFPLKM